MNLKIKKNIILLLLIIVAFVGCNKDNFTGHWHIYSHTSDMFDVYDIDQSVGDDMSVLDNFLGNKPLKELPSVEESINLYNDWMGSKRGR